MVKKRLPNWKKSIPKVNVDVSSKGISKGYKKVEGATVKHARRFVFRRINNFRAVRWNIALWVLIMGVLIGAAGLQIIWYQQHYRTTVDAQDGTYAEAVLGPLSTLNPIFANSSAEDSLSRLLFSRLLRYDETGNLSYDLVQSAGFEEDRKKYTVKLRTDVQWQDGIYVRARDVVFTVDLIKNPATRASITGWDSVTATAVDDLTVTFTLPSTYAAFPHLLALLPILPEHILRDVPPSALRENSFSTSPVVSGPFIVRYIQDINRSAERKIVHLARNPDFHRGVVGLDRFQVHVFGSRDAIIKAANSGEVNAATDMTITDTQNITRGTTIVEQKPINSGMYALFNTKSSALSNKDVRRALQIGTDTQAIRDAVSSQLQPLYLPFTSTQLNGSGVPSAPKYDKTRAQNMLNEAGWRLEDGVRVKDGNALRLSVVALKNNDSEKALDALVSQWRDLGVVVTTNIVDPNDQLQNVAQTILQPRQYDVLLYQLTLGGDPDFVYAYWHSSQSSDGLNLSNYENTISDEALESARQRVDANLRREKYISFSKQWLSDAPAIGLYQVSAQYAYSRSVHAMPAHQVLISAGDRYATVPYWTVGERQVYRTP